MSLSQIIFCRYLTSSTPTASEHAPLSCCARTFRGVDHTWSFGDLAVLWIRGVHRTIDRSVPAIFWDMSILLKARRAISIVSVLYHDCIVVNFVIRWF